METFNLVWKSKLQVGWVFISSMEANVSFQLRSNFCCTPADIVIFFLFSAMEAGCFERDANGTEIVNLTKSLHDNNYVLGRF